MIYLTGDSHIGCLLRAFNRKREAYSHVQNLGIFPIAGGYKFKGRFFTAQNDQIRFHIEKAHDQLEKHFGHPYLNTSSSDLMYGFSMRMHPFPVCAHKTWYTHRPWQFNTEEYLLLSNDVLHTIIWHDLEPNISFYSSLKERNVPFFVIESPPLNANLPIMKQRADGAQRTDKTLIRFLDEQYRKTYRNWLAENDIDIVNYPVAAAGSDGFLKPEFHHEKEGDYRHANPDYGELMLAAILDYLEDRHPDRLK